jgi:hypothetical protein
MTIKYRPSLTIEEIHIILAYLPTIPEYRPLTRKLEVFTLKATYGITQGSHITTGRASLESQLGMAEDTTIATLLDAFQSNPGLLSNKQLERVQYHRYTHDLMDKGEEHSYESRAETLTDWSV